MVMLWKNMKNFGKKLMQILCMDQVCQYDVLFEGKLLEMNSNKEKNALIEK